MEAETTIKIRSLVEQSELEIGIKVVHLTDTRRETRHQMKTTMAQKAKMIIGPSRQRKLLSYTRTIYLITNMAKFWNIQKYTAQELLTKKSEKIQEITMDMTTTVGIIVS